MIHFGLHWCSPQNTWAFTSLPNYVFHHIHSLFLLLLQQKDTWVFVLHQSSFYKIDQKNSYHSITAAAVFIMSFFTIQVWSCSSNNRDVLQPIIIRGIWSVLPKVKCSLLATKQQFLPTFLGSIITHCIKQHLKLYIEITDSTWMGSLTEPIMTFVNPQSNTLDCR